MALVDLAAFQFNQNGTVVQALAAPQSSGEEISGVAKMAQKFMIAFLTRKGSVPYLPEQGSNFLNILIGGLISNEQDVFQATAAALVDVNPQLRNQITDDDLDEEKYVRATIERIFISGDTVELRMKLINELEEIFTVLVPVPFPGIR